MSYGGQRILNGDVRVHDTVQEAEIDLLAPSRSRCNNLSIHLFFSSPLTSTLLAFFDQFSAKLLQSRSSYKKISEGIHFWYEEKRSEWMALK